jgi:hypothetical protein
VHAEHADERGVRCETRGPTSKVSRAANAAPHNAQERTTPICAADRPSRAAYKPMRTAINPMASARRKAAV